MVSPNHLEQRRDIWRILRRFRKSWKSPKNICNVWLPETSQDDMDEEPNYLEGLAESRWQTIGLGFLALLSSLHCMLSGCTRAWDKPRHGQWLWCPLSGLVPSRFHITFSICQGHALKMGALQLSYVKPRCTMYMMYWMAVSFHARHINSGHA
jgi:hypothetical protein